MSQDSSEKPKVEGHAGRQKDRAAEIANTFEWLITAFILAFVFRAFVMEAFRIPTGSMASTLMGAHFRVRCPQCGYEYQHGFSPRDYGMGEDSVPAGSQQMPPTRCPSCNHFPPGGPPVSVANGDRILVLKCIYQFFDPRRWDVIVFKNPLEPQINYIKRLVALPGETVEIIDGDVYIDGQIVRKPPKVQRELWMPVYDHDFQPIKPKEPTFSMQYNRPWVQPFRTADSDWDIPPDHPTVFQLDSDPGDRQTMHYDSGGDLDFRATYAYNAVREYPYLPYCSDLMVRFYVQAFRPEGQIGVELSKYDVTYRGWVDFNGQMVIAREEEDGSETVLNSKPLDSAATIAAETAPLRFANVDHQLILEFGDEQLHFDLGRDANDAGTIREDVPPHAAVFGAGELALLHVAVFRDIHYTRTKYAGSTEIGRGTQDNPFTLGDDQFFVLGDNSPNSQDSRWWESPGIGNAGGQYDMGVVPRDYLVGKALFVYWPSGFKPFARFPLAAIPNVGKMRFIYGGSDDTLTH